MSRAWVRMYRTESRSFEQLPLVVRGLAMEFLKLTDDQGVIVIGAKTPEEAFAFALGATRSDRRAINAAVPALVSAGFFYVDGHVVRVRNFPKYQHTSHEQVTDKSRASLVQVSCNENEAKCAKPRVGTDVALKREKNTDTETERAGAEMSVSELRSKRAEENRAQAAAMSAAIALAPKPVAADETDADLEAKARWLWAEYRLRYAKRRGFDCAEWAMNPHPVLPTRTIRDAWLAHVSAGDSATFEQAAGGCMAQWFRSEWGEKTDYSWASFCKSFTRFIPSVRGPDDAAKSANGR